MAVNLSPRIKETISVASVKMRDLLLEISMLCMRQGVCRMIRIIDSCSLDNPETGHLIELLGGIGDYVITDPSFGLKLSHT